MPIEVKDWLQKKVYTLNYLAKIGGLHRIVARLCSGFILLFFAIAAAPTWADQVKTDKAVASYLSATLPTIERLKPYIGQPDTARARAFAGTGIPRNVCDAAAVDAIYAQEDLAEGSANICRALIAWMEGSDVIVCSNLKYSKSDLAKVDLANASIRQRHIAADVDGTVAQLSQAAECGQKNIAHWGSAVIRMHRELTASLSVTGNFVAASPGGVALSSEDFADKLFQCHVARNIDDTVRFAVVEAADDGCYAMSSLARNNVLGACKSIEEGLKLIDPIGAGAPFAREAPAVRTLLIDSFSDLTCGPMLTAAHAEERATAAKIQQAEKARAAQATYDAAWTAYKNLQNRLARDFQELREWDEEYGVSSDGGDATYAQVADGYCQIYNRINQTQFDILNAVETINRLQPNTDNLNRLHEEQKTKEQMNIDRNGWCELKLD